METNSVSIDQRLDRIEHLIALNKPVLNFDEAVSYTGLSKSYLYKMTASRQIPHSKPNGKQLYFERAALDHWLMRNEVKTAEAVEAEAINYVVTKKNRK